MNKSGIRTAPTRNRASNIRGYAIVAVVSACIGASTVWLVTNRDHVNSTSPVPTSPEPAIPTPPSTAGVAPAQAELILANWNYDRQNWPHAIEHYEKAIAQGLDNADVRTDLGNCHRFLGESQKALELYSIAQGLDPHHEQSLYNTATLYAEVLGNRAKAAEVFRDFIQRFPQSPSAAAAQQYLADSRGSPKDHSEIIKWLEKAPPNSNPTRPDNSR